MGQGADDADAAGWAHEYDEYEEGLRTGTWTMRDGETINVSDMTLKHLYGARAVAERARQRATFSCNADMWAAWVELFDDEIYVKANKPKVQPTTTKPAVATEPAKPKAAPRGATQWMKCHCGTEYPARVADLKRGWGYSCGKRCAAIRRDFGCPPAKKIDKK